MDHGQMQKCVADMYRLPVALPPTTAYSSPKPILPSRYFYLTAVPLGY